jgi:thiol-disulfide isomerase/thioredoxin
LLDFWSRGCGPCIAAIPEMKEIAEKYKDRLVIVSISSDTKDLWIEASQKEGITWANFNDFKGNNGLFARYGVVGIPNYFLIAPDGIINSSWMGYGTGSLLAKMEELIGAN